MARSAWSLRRFPRMRSTFAQALLPSLLAPRAIWGYGGDPRTRCLRASARGRVGLGRRPSRAPLSCSAASSARRRLSSSTARTPTLCRRRCSSMVFRVVFEAGRDRPSTSLGRLLGLSRSPPSPCGHPIGACAMLAAARGPGFASFRAAAASLFGRSRTFVDRSLQTPLLRGQLVCSPASLGPGHGPTERRCTRVA